MVPGDGATYGAGVTVLPVLVPAPSVVPPALPAPPVPVPAVPLLVPPPVKVGAAGTGSAPITPPLLLLSAGAASVRPAVLVWRIVPPRLSRSAPALVSSTLAASSVPVLLSSPLAATFRLAALAMVPLLATLSADSLASTLACRVPRFSSRPAEVTTSWPTPARPALPLPAAAWMVPALRAPKPASVPIRVILPAYMPPSAETSSAKVGAGPAPVVGVTWP